MDPHNTPTGDNHDQNFNNTPGGDNPTDGAANGWGNGGNATGGDNALDFDLDTFDPATATPEQIAQLKEFAATAKEGYEKYKGRYKSTKAKQQPKSPQGGDLESIVDSKVNEAIKQTNFWQENPDAVEYKDKITSTAKEKNLSLEEATKLVMFDIKTDPGYVARQRWTATAVHGSTSPSKDKKGPMSSIVWKTPGFIAKMRQQKEASKN